MDNVQEYLNELAGLGAHRQQKGLFDYRRAAAMQNCTTTGLGGYQLSFLGSNFNPLVPLTVGALGSHINQDNIYINRPSPSYIPLYTPPYTPFYKNETSQRVAYCLLGILYGFACWGFCSYVAP